MTLHRLKQSQTYYVAFTNAYTTYVPTTVHCPNIFPEFWHKIWGCHWWSGHWATVYVWFFLHIQYRISGTHTNLTFTVASASYVTDCIWLLCCPESGFLLAQSWNYCKQRLLLNSSCFESSLGGTFLFFSQLKYA